MPKKISVLTVTHRSWDMLARQALWLAEQTFPVADFEWVIVDERQHKRPFIVTGMHLPFRVRHLQDPVSGEFIDNGAAGNFGLSHCDGDLVFFMTDYIRPLPRVLERHWELQRRLGPAIISGPLAWRAANDDASQPNQERQGDVPQDDYISLVTNHYEKVRRFSWLGRNDSAPMQAILECNGFDERLNGYRGGIDPVLSMQLVNWGCRYFIDSWPEALCYEYGHDKERKPERGPNIIWQGLFETAYHEKLIRTPNAFSLAARRAINLADAIADAASATRRPPRLES